MLGSRVRATLLGLMALLIVGSYAASSAYAEGGPFCHHRALNGEGEGELIKGASPEQVKGSGGEQKLAGEVAGGKVELLAGTLQIKGITYNNADQCQAKVELEYSKLSVVEQPNCSYKINTNNVVKLYGHRAWKWNGEASQLTVKPQSSVQFPDWIFTPVELAPGAEVLPSGTYAVITFSGASCLENGIKATVTGSVTAETIPSGIGKWSVEEEQIIKGGKAKQHFWTGTKFVGVETGLLLGGVAASYNGAAKVGTAGKGAEARQEIGLFES